jgi:phosphoglycerate dehydrogenase-like enzyme
MSAGLDGALFPELIASPIPMTNGRAVFSRSLGEWAMAAILFFAKDLRRLVRSQQAGRWDQFDVEWVHGKTLGIVGYGSIGESIAERARPFGLKIAAYRRRPELSAGGHVFGPGRLHEMLAISDYVALAAPLTPETRGLIDEAALRAMKPGAVLINVGRGPLIVEEALIRALREGWIRGAALDVFDREPLPEGHAFYGLENLLLSPHSADHTPGWSDTAMEFFVQNFERFTAGQPLLNLVDKQAGY